MIFWDWAFNPFVSGTPGDDDGTAARAYLAEMEAMLKERGIPKSVPVALRLVEVLSATLTARALEQAVYDKGVVQGGTDEVDPKLHPLVEAMAKAMERRRKALSELEESCACAGKPAEFNLPDALRPLLKRTEGVLEDALEFERKRTSRKTSQAGEQRG